MSTTTMHFGPEWMRTKHQPLSRSQPPPSPPPTNTIQGSGLSTYSALVSAMPSVPSETGDIVHPFRYSKEELLKIYQEGGGKGGLGLEVERWEGVVREGGTEPATLREMTEAEKKLFAGPLNSELRRRPSQSTEYISPLTTSGLDRPRLSHNPSSTSNNNSPLRERFGALKRRDSAAGASDPVMPTLPRKPSLSALQTPTLSPREAPRSRVAYTPGFDGVLNNGDSWVARRRTSEASMKLGSGSSRETTDAQLGIMVSGIREEKEEEPRISMQARPTEDSNVFVSSSPHVHSEEPPMFAAVTADVGTSQTSSQTNSFSANGANNSDAFPVDRADIGPPPGLVDLAGVEWSYKDPTGQIQGPFRADLMQKWYNDGYFSSDLPMKRVRYDSQWTTIEELSQRAQGENIFLSSTFMPNPPSRGNASPLHTYSSSEHLHNEPFQPSPVRSLLSSTLESYLSTGSLASDSPSSSVGASHFGIPSPDPSVFGGRDNKTYFGGDPNGRLSGLGVQNQPSPFAERRTIGHEFQANPIMQSHFANFVSDRDVGFNTYGYNNVPVIHDPWGISSNLPSSEFIASRDQGNDKLYQLSNASLNVAHHRPEGPHDEHLPRNFNQDTPYINEDLGNFSVKQPGPGIGSLNYNHYQYPGQSPFQNVQDQHQPYVAPVPDFAKSHESADLYAYRPPNPDSVVPQPLPNVHSNSSTIPAVPWNSLPEEQPSEVVEANAAIIVSNNLSNSPWNYVESAPSFSSQINDSTTALLPEKDDSWKETVLPKNIAQHELPPSSQLSEQKKNRTPEPIDQNPETPEPVATLPLSSSAPAAGKKASKAVSPSQATHQSPTTPSVTGDAAATPVVQKVAWAKEEESKKKIASSPSVSLREIQEAEAKKLETRKAAERERERLARASASADIKEEVQPFTTSWGLPTSQAGARGTVPVRDLASVPAQVPATQPVWTTPLKQPATKKTMKEIQEEEETRKKIASKETPSAVVPKRAYAETTTKVTATPPLTSSNGNVWTTVGPSGKASSIATPPVRQTPHVPGSFSATQTSRTSASPISKVTASSVVKKLVKQDEFPETPSHDFLKWLGDSLKGLNSSVNVEEIVSMLLSFPIDPDSSTVEIISDTIYSNSTTLDGRRFASEFVAKRKADVLARAKGSVNSSGKAASKPVSIADVVKATPKTAQPEWGFKVVNKKKKGGRS